MTALELLENELGRLAINIEHAHHRRRASLDAIAAADAQIETWKADREAIGRALKILRRMTGDAAGGAA